MEIIREMKVDRETVTTEKLKHQCAYVSLSVQFAANM